MRRDPKNRMSSVYDATIGWLDTHAKNVVILRNHPAPAIAKMCIPANASLR